jgi:hypothetical protein
MTASVAPLDLLAGWRYPRTQPSLPESNASVPPETRPTGEGSTI